jgi:flagellar protein FliT
MSAAQVIANYELLSALTVQMRNAAQQGAWDQLISIESQRTALLADMKPVDAVAELDEAAHRRKVQLIEKILADDAQTRNYTQVWMSQLQLNIDSNSTEQRLRQAYGV